MVRSKDSWAYDVSGGGGRQHLGIKVWIWLTGVVDTRTRTSFRYASGLIRWCLQVSMIELCGAPHNSIIESCRMNGVESWAYLKDVLIRVWTHPSGMIGELMPRTWRPPPGETNTS